MQKKLLLAEDSATMQKVFGFAFEKSSISVIPVDNGDDAVRLAEEISPDLVVADVTLPGKDGFEVAAALAAGETTRGIPVLILSGTQAPFDEERMKACGAKGVLFKPFETAGLLEKVDGLLGTREEAVPAAESPEPPPPPADEHWDFSDVLDEVEEKAPPATPEAAAATADAMSPGDILKSAGKDPAAGYDEFDISIDDLEEPAAPQDSPADGASPEEPPPAEAQAAGELSELEEIEEIEELEEAAGPVTVAEAAETPREEGREPEEEIFGEPAAPAPPIEPAAPAPTIEPVAPAPPTEPAAPAAEAGEEALRAALREQFSARAEVVFREVAAEAVEKVMWEMMDRLAGEFSAKIRESVEAVAWEVIPATAEALIREEISRIRTQAGKSIPS